MKKILLMLSVVAVCALTVYGQGRVAFNNITSGNAITIDPVLPIAAGEGAAGANLGSTYSIDLVWAPQATYGSQAAFLAAALGSSSPIAFFGTTGGSPITDGAGLFDSGVVPSPVGTSMPAGKYTMEAFAWFNGGTFATYAAALAGGANTGFSGFFTQVVTAAPAGVNATIFPSFTVAVPEPSTIAMLGLGMAALLAFRRRS